MKCLMALFTYFELNFNLILLPMKIIEISAKIKSRAQVGLVCSKNFSKK